MREHYICKDYEIYKELFKGTDDVSYDKLNKEIVQFCTMLFQIWLNDYVLYVEKVKERNYSYMLYILNEGMKKNVEDKCLPLDYFIQRML